LRRGEEGGDSQKSNFARLQQATPRYITERQDQTKKSRVKKEKDRSDTTGFDLHAQFQDFHKSCSTRGRSHHNIHNYTQKSARDESNYNEGKFLELITT
jgi:hypothetical protein